MPKSCPHVPPTPHAPRAAGCEECLAAGGRWLHLRLCLSCGHVGCCDDSPSRHASLHFQSSRHPVIQSFEPGEDWGWCYVDQSMLGPFPPARLRP